MGELQRTREVLIQDGSRQGYREALAVSTHVCLMVVHFYAVQVRFYAVQVRFLVV